MRRLLLAAAMCACSSTPRTTAPSADRAVINLHAFARLYGVVRWFHPSDEGAAIDWNRFATAGVARVRGAATADQLAAALTELVHPIAPTVVIGPTRKPPAPNVPATGPGIELVWWQHEGPGLTGDAPPYTSKRRGRPAPAAAAPMGFAMVGQNIDATPYRGQRIRLRARVAAAHGGHGQLWLRIDRPDHQKGFFDNMDDRKIGTTAWTEATIEGTIADDAEGIVFGALMTGAGDSRYDDFRLDVATASGDWTPVAIKNPGFDHDLTDWFGSVPDPSKPLENYVAIAEPDDNGGNVVALVPVTAPPRLTEPFEDKPRPDEVSVVDLGDGLSAWVPLVVASRDGRTVPAGDPSSLAAAMAAPVADADAGVADVVVTWNVFAHFYPYLDVIDTDWTAELDAALSDAADDQTPDDRSHTLDRLVASAHDGHGRVMRAGESFAAPPLDLAWVDDRIVVVASDDDRVRPGDVVVTIDGVAATRRADERAALTSGSPQWARTRGAAEAAVGPVDTKAVLHLERAGAAFDVEIARTQWGQASAPRRTALGEIAPGIWYVDLGRAELGAIAIAMPKLAAARGVVFDMRGYPNKNGEVVAHIITAPDTAKWMHVARMVRPFQHQVVGWNDLGWDLAPAAPHLDHVVFLTGPDAISYAESVMGYAQAEGVPIVGAASAGTNGSVQVVDVPSGARISFTGMRVTRHDGGRHHLLGVAPTIPVARTIAGVAAGRDEVLEAGIAALQR